MASKLLSDVKEADYLDGIGEYVRELAKIEEVVLSPIEEKVIELYKLLEDQRKVVLHEVAGLELLLEEERKEKDSAP